MASITIDSSSLGTSLSALLTCADIQPGDDPSYQLCKTIFLFHPLGQKIAAAPVKMAQFLPREITIPDGPEKELVEAFTKQWVADNVEFSIRYMATLARAYGITSLGVLTKGSASSSPLDLKALYDETISFNVFDPLNTAGSLVTSQDPNSMQFQKHGDIAVAGQVYHRSRTVTLMNDVPIYIYYNSAAFGFTGQSCYQRNLFPLKSFVQTMIADDMVSRKAGLLIAKLKMAGSVINAIMQAAASIKRTILKLGATENVLSISTEEDVMSVDLTNIDGPLTMARKHILENIASGADMPALLLNNETFTQGFGEGDEDAKAVAAFVDGIRTWLAPVYTFMDSVTQRRAWNPNFFKSIQDKYHATYDKVAYEEAFYSWSNSFKAVWPSLLREPESEQVRVADMKMKAVIALAQVLLPEMDPENKTKLMEWLEDQTNNTKLMFTSPLELDFEALEKYFIENKDKMDQQAEEGGEGEPRPAPPFSARDSVVSYLKQPDMSDIPGRIASLEQYMRRIKA